MELPDDALMLYLEYEQGAYANNPHTGEPMLPPLCKTAMCTEASLESVRTSEERLAESRGWRISQSKVGGLFG